MTYNTKNGGGFFCENIEI